MKFTKEHEELAKAAGITLGDYQPPKKAEQAQLDRAEVRRDNALEVSTTKAALERLERFYNEKLKPLGDEAAFNAVAGSVEITHEEKNAIFWLVYQMRLKQQSRSKGGKTGGGGRPKSKKPSATALYQRERRARLKQKNRTDDGKKLE